MMPCACCNGRPMFACSRNSQSESKKPLRILILLGSSREGRVGDRVVRLVQVALENAGHIVDSFDPLDLDLPVLRQALHFQPFPPKNLSNLNQRITDADAFIIVTAEYNRQLPPALTNLIDYFPPKSYAGKSCAIISYSMGHYGGQIAASMARILMVEMGAMPVPFMLIIGEAHERISEDGKTSSEHVLTGLQKLVLQLEWWAKATRRQRQSVGAMPQSIGTKEALHFGKELLMDTIRKKLA